MVGMLRAWKSAGVMRDWVPVRWFPLVESSYGFEKDEGDTGERG